MGGKKKSLFEYTIEELDRELIARGAQVPDVEKFYFNDKEGTPERDAVMSRVKELYQTSPSRNESLSHIGTWDLAKVLIFKSQPFLDVTRGEGTVELNDWNEILDDKAKKNAECVSAICFKDNLTDTNKGTSILKVKNYGKTFNLCDNEFFHDQPISAGHMGTGFLVRNDVIATSSHFIDENNVTDLRFVFGYKMVDASIPVTEFSKDNVYSGIKILHRRESPGNNHGNCLLVKLDRKVEGWEIAALSKDEVYWGQIVYILGHPLGLPLKYGSGASVFENITETFFWANLNMYSGCLGAPVFDINTHEIIGMVVKEADCDLRWTGKGWLSVQKPNGPGVDCFKISALSQLCPNLFFRSNAAV